MSNLMNTYTQQPISFIRGSATLLYDKNNTAYIDAISGIAVCSLGHSHPNITQVICEQSKLLIHTSNIYQIQQQQQLSNTLTALSGMDKTFFCNSGAEANETALKIARKYGRQRHINNPKIIVMDNSFHGRTFATLSATSNPKVHEGFEPLLDIFIRVPFNDIQSIQSIENKSDIVAILVEPIQGEGGVQIPSNGYLKGLRKLCDDNQWLLMMDEIQTGIGRTGRWFAFQYEDILPDVLTLAKALGNGFPIGVCLAKGIASEVLVPGSHGTTFGGNPLACATAIEVINTIQQQLFISKVQQRGAEFLQQLKDKLEPMDNVVAIRGKGFMFGIELKHPCTDLVKKALDRHILINVTQGNVIRLLPPFVITNEQLNQITNTLHQIISEI